VFLTFSCDRPTCLRHVQFFYVFSNFFSYVISVSYAICIIVGLPAITCRCCHQSRQDIASQFITAPPMEERNVVMSVSVSPHAFLTVHSLPNCMCMLLMVVARSSSNGVVKCISGFVDDVVFVYTKRFTELWPRSECNLQTNVSIYHLSSES